MGVLLFSGLFRVNVGVDVNVRVPRYRTTRLMVVMPVVRRLVSVLLADLVFLYLKIVRVRYQSFAGRRNFRVNAMAFLNGLIHVIYCLRLNLLVVRLFCGSGRVLVRVRNFLAWLTFNRVTIALDCLCLAAAFSPIGGEGLGASFRGLIIFRATMYAVGFVIYSYGACLYVRLSFAWVAFHLDRFGVYFRLTTAGVVYG